MNNDWQARWRAPDNRLVSYRFFLHFADFLDYIREGIKAAYPYETADQSSKIQHFSQLWEADLLTCVWVFSALAVACTYAPRASKSAHVTGTSLYPKFWTHALAGDGSQQIREIVDCGIVLEIFAGRTLLGKMPVAQSLIRRCVLEKLKSEMRPRREELYKTWFVRAPSMRAMCSQRMTLLEDVLQTLNDEAAWIEGRRRIEMQRSWNKFLMSKQRVDSTLGHQPSELLESDDQCLGSAATIARPGPARKANSC